MATLRIATWNLKGGTENLNAVADHLVKERVEVVGLQEVNNIGELHYRLVRETGQFRECLYVPSTYGSNGPTGQNAVAIFSQYSIVEYGYRYLGNDAGGGNPWERNIVYAKIAGGLLAVFNTHFSVNDADARRRNVSRSLEFMKSLEHRRQILLGDLNMTPQSDILAPIRTSFQDQGNNGNEYTFNAHGTLGSRLDYHFAKGIRASGIKTFGGSTSDHRGVVADYEIEDWDPTYTYCRLLQRSTRKYLDGRFDEKDNNPPAKVYTHDAIDSAHQHWQLLEDPSNKGQFFIKHIETGFFLDTKSSGSNSGSDRVYLHWPNMGKNQRWMQIPVSGNRIKIQNVATGKLLDANSSGDVYTLNDNGGDYQIWTKV